MNTDSTFDASMEAPVTPEPALFLVLASGFRLAPRLGQDDAFHTQLNGTGFIISGVGTTVGAGLLWWLTKSLNMTFRPGLPLGLVGRTATVPDTERLICLRLGEPNHVTELSFLIGLATADDIRDPGRGQAFAYAVLYLLK